MPLDVETHGIEPIPAAARTRGWFDLFAMVAGINICLPMMLLGATMVPGLSFPAVIAVGLLGYLIAGSVACLAAYPGVDHGLPVAVMSRIVLGYPRGMWLASGCSVISQLGWYAVQAELAGLAADAVLSSVTGHSMPLVMIGLMGGLNVFFAVMGFAWMQWLASWSVPMLLLLSAWLFATIASQHPFLALVSRPGDGSLTFLAALGLAVSGQIAGGFTMSDLSRYARSHRAAWIGILLGIAPVSAAMMSLGALSRLASGEWNPVLSVQNLNLGIPALLLIVFATWTTNDKNLYSGGLALTNLFPARPRWQHTLLLGSLGTLLGCVRVTQVFTGWLIALGIVFAPLVGLILADYFVVERRRPRIEDAYRIDGAYRYTGGVNLAALAAIACGVTAGRMAPRILIEPLVSLVVTMTAFVVATRILYPARFVRDDVAPDAAAASGVPLS